MCLGTAYTQQNLEIALPGWSLTVAEIKYVFLHINSKAASKCQGSYSVCYCCCVRCWVSTTKFLTDLLSSTFHSKSFSPQWWEWLSNAVYSFMRFLFFQTAVCSRHCHLLSHSQNTISPPHSFHCPAAVIPFFWLWFLKPFSVPHSPLSITLLLDYALFHQSSFYLWPPFSAASFPKCPLLPHLPHKKRGTLLTCLNFSLWRGGLETPC